MNNLNFGKNEKVRILKDQSGTLYEIPICWASYFILCAIVVPPIMKKFSSLYAPLVIIMPFGLLASFMAGLAISEPRLRILKVPPSVWSYILLAAIALAIMYFGEMKIMMFVILGIPLASFWLDMILSSLLEKKKSNEERKM